MINMWKHHCLTDSLSWHHYPSLRVMQAINSVKQLFNRNRQKPNGQKLPKLGRNFWESNSADCYSVWYNYLLARKIMITNSPWYNGLLFIMLFFSSFLAKRTVYRINKTTLATCCFDSLYLQILCDFISHNMCFTSLFWFHYQTVQFY